MRKKVGLAKRHIKEEQLPNQPPTTVGLIPDAEARACRRAGDRFAAVARMEYARYRREIVRESREADARFVALIKMEIRQRAAATGPFRKGAV